MIESERMTYRPMRLDDLGWLVEMRSDPDVNKFIGGDRLQNPDEVARRLRFYIECHEKYGFGQCAMLWKETGEPIGTSGLQPLEDSGEIEVGYSLKKEFWRRGLGYECAMAWLDWGFNRAGLDRIVAVTDPANVGSWRIMEKCGMTFEGETRHYDMTVKFYAISKKDFNGGTAS